MRTPTLRRHDNGIIFMHWTEQTAPGQRGRSKRRTTGTADMDAAKRFLGKFLLLDQAEPATNGNLTVADCWTVYDAKHIQKHVAAPDTLAFSWKNLEPHFGLLMVSQVSQDTVDSYELKRARGQIGRPAKASTVRRELNALRGCFNWCAEPKRGILAKDMLPAFDLPPEGDPNDRWLRADEIERLFRAAVRVSRRMDGGGRMGRGERFLWLALETAGRSEALRQLTWDRVDFDTRTIDLNKPGRKKTKKRRAVVPISAALLPALQCMHRERVNNHVLDNEAPVWKLIERIARRAEVPDVSPHVLRHTAATHMARRGVPLWLVAKVLGNSLQMTERVYAKHCPEDLRVAVDTISVGG